MCQKVQLRGTVSTLPHYYHPARLKLTQAQHAQTAESFQYFEIASFV